MTDAPGDEPTSVEELLSKRLRWDDAKALSGETLELFPLDSGPDRIPLTVVEVTARASSDAMLQFSILLRGPADPVLAQRTYRFRHARLGDYAFFVTAVARSAAGTDYEACFSHAP